MWLVKHRYRASNATRPSNFTICSTLPASLAPKRWRPAITSPPGGRRTVAVRSSARARRRAIKAISCSLPRASNSISCGSRSATRPRPKHASWHAALVFRLPTSMIAKTSALCLPAVTPRSSSAFSRVRPSRAISSTVPLYVVRLDAAARRVVVGPREALATRRLRLRDVNWLGDGAIDDVLAAGRLDVFVKVRSTRPPQPAWLARGPDGIVVDLVDGEEGVAPGQACVFYDAAEGQARVLGGGFIKSATSTADVVAAR